MSRDRPSRPPKHPVVAYLEERSRYRRETAGCLLRAMLAIIVALILAVLAVRTVNHFTGYGARTTYSLNLAPHSGPIRTVVTPQPIIP